jgi:hypothetical protein
VPRGRGDAHVELAPRQHHAGHHAPEYGLQSPGIQSINTIAENPAEGWIALGSDQTELDALGAAAMWRGATLASWQPEPEDPATFGDRNAAPAAVINDAVAGPEGVLVAVGMSNETVSLPGGASFCCLSQPAVWLFDSRLAGAS